jgi:hypothetical protein
MPILPTTQKAEIKMTGVQGKPGQNESQALSQEYPIQNKKH